MPDRVIRQYDAAKLSRGVHRIIFFFFVLFCFVHAIILCTKQLTERSVGSSICDCCFFQRRIGLRNPLCNLHRCLTKNKWTNGCSISRYSLLTIVAFDSVAKDEQQFVWGCIWVSLHAGQRPHCVLWIWIWKPYSDLCITDHKAELRKELKFRTEIMMFALVFFNRDDEQI